MTIEDDLRDAMHVHVERIEPSAGGLQRIEARLAPSSSRPRLSTRLLVAAAVLLVIGGVGAMALRGGSDGEVVALPSTNDPNGAAAVENELAPLDGQDDEAGGNDSSSTEVSEANPNSFDLPAAPAGILGPRASTPGGAVKGFLELIQRDGEDVSWEIEGSLARVSRILENGEVGDVTVLQLGSVDMEDGSRGVVVVQALSPRAVIESPSSLSTINGSTLTVSGQGEGFEEMPTVTVELFSSRDGVWLARRAAMAGNFGVPAPFSVDLDLSGPGPAWVVVQASSGTETRLDPFSAVPVVIDAPLAGYTHLVTSIPVGDPDGGLVVRSLPGTGGERLAVLPSGQSGIRKRAALSAFVGDGEPIYGEQAEVTGEEWWNVWLPAPLVDGRQWGWVNSRYLTIDAAVADDDLRSIGDGFVAGLRGDDGAFVALPWSSRGVTIGLQSDLRSVSAATLTGSDFWNTSDEWTLPGEFVGPLETTGRVLFSPTQRLLGEYKVDVALRRDFEVSPYGNQNAMFASQFAGASVVQLRDPSNDGSGWRTVNLFVAMGATGPEIVGVVGVVWVP